MIPLLAALLLAAPCPDARPVTSPCEGVLVPTGQAREALGCLRVDLPQCQSLLRAREAEGAAQIAACRADEAAALEERDVCLAALNRPLPVVEAPVPWWRSPVLWGVAGLAVGVGATVAIVEVAR